MSASIRTRLRRAGRWFLLGAGPLKRRSDRLQVAGRVVVTLSLLAAVPLALFAAGLTRTRLEAVAAEQAATRHQVRAVVLASATSPAAPGAGAASGTGMATVEAIVGWHERGHPARRAGLLVPAGTAAGTTVPVWLDRRGELTGAPLDRAGLGDTVLIVGISVAAGLPLLVLALHCGLCAVLDVRRRSRWAKDWLRVEREWRARLG